MKKILLLYTSHTQGHKAIAENMAFYLEQDGYEVKLADVLEVQSGWLVEWTTKAHRFVNEHLPSLWSFLYLNKWFINISLPYRIKIASKNFYNLKLLVEGFNPDIIITTQTTASALVAYLKNQTIFMGKFGIAFSDFHLHRYWLYDQADFYLANIEEQKQELIGYGILVEKIFVCGVMLKPEQPVDVEQVKIKFGIGPYEKVILISSGSLGLGLDESLINELTAIEHARVIIVCGNNTKLFQRLSNKYKSSNVVVFGYYANMEELYSIADIFLSKPGGLSVAEGLRKRLPILISHMLPGQEELNYSYLLEKGLVMPEPLNTEEEVAEELEQGRFKKVLQENVSIHELFPKPEVLLDACRSVLQNKE